jgi:uncharacterized protein YndB with AHSA1/START domain
MIGATGVGLFTTDPMPIHPPLSKIGKMHVIFGTSQLVLFPFAALLINVSLVRRNQMWTSARRALVWSAGLPLAGFAAFALYSAIFVFPLGTGAYGPGVNIGWPPRFAFFTYMLWVVTVGWQAIRCNHRFSAPGGAQEDVAMPRGIVAKASISVHAPLAVVWDALVNPAVIRRYMFGTNVVSDFKPGSPIAWKGEWKGKAYEDKGVILRFEPEQVLSYSHFSPMTGLPDKPENYHTVTIELSRRGEETLLSLSQDNNPTDDARAHSEENWTAMLKGIKALVEKQEPTGQSGSKW